MSKTLTAYFSASGTTAEVAKGISEAAHSDLYEIKPVQPYTSADLDWTNQNSRSSIEMKDRQSRPEIDDKSVKIEQYDTIFLGFPIWWYVAPHIINTFLESHDFSGKKIVIFATSGGSGFGNTAEELKKSCHGEIVEGKILNGALSPQQAQSFVENYL